MKCHWAIGQNLMTSRDPPQYAKHSFTLESSSAHVRGGGTIQQRDFPPTLVHSTPPITKNKCAEILLHYRQLFVKGDVFIGEWHVFGAEVFLRYSRFFIKGDFVTGGVECK